MMTMVMLVLVLILMAAAAAVHVGLWFVDQEQKLNNESQPKVYCEQLILLWVSSGRRISDA